ARLRQGPDLRASGGVRGPGHGARLRFCVSKGLKPNPFTTRKPTVNYGTPALVPTGPAYLRPDPHPPPLMESVCDRPSTLLEHGADHPRRGRARGAAGPPAAH